MEVPSADTAPSGVSKFATFAGQRYQKFMDDIVPFLASRWLVFGLLICFFLLRIILIQGFYIVTYALAIYLLNLFIAFLTPNFDPSITDSEDEDGPSLPTKADEEFKPFVRKLAEFKFWQSGMRAVLISFFCTFFKMFDVPVFWPILVVYFFTLFGITMKRQIKHMIKYKYIPFTTGKKTYKKEGKAESY